MTTPTSTDTQTVVDAVVRMFMADGRDHSIKEVAAALGWSESRVRRAITSAPGGRPDELDSSVDYRTSYSRDYPTMEAGAHKVRLYGPTRQTLREMLLRTGGIL